MYVLCMDIQVLQYVGGVGYIVDIVFIVDMWQVVCWMDNVLQCVLLWVFVIYYGCLLYYGIMDVNYIVVLWM